jgi:hypothetical protein
MPVLAVDLDGSGAGLDHGPPPAWLPCVVVGVGASPGAVPAPAGVDVALAAADDGGDAPPGWVTATDPDAELERVSAAVGATPHAAVILAQVLRLTEPLRVEAALSVESLAYSGLQSGPEFAGWLATRRRCRGPAPAPPAPRCWPSVATTCCDWC